MRAALPTRRSQSASPRADVRRASTLFVLAFVATAFASCGGGDPLIGSWRTTVNALNRVVVVTIEFQMAGQLQITQTLPPDPNATMYQGCTEIRHTTGGQWSEDSSTQVTVNMDFATYTIERTGCNSASDNSSPMTDNAPLPVLSNGTYTYSISGSELQLTQQGGSSPLVLDRVQ